MMLMYFRLNDQDLNGLSKIMVFMVFRATIFISGLTVQSETGRLIFIMV